MSRSRVQARQLLSPLAELQGAKAVYTDKFESHHQVRLLSRIGRTAAPFSLPVALGARPSGCPSFWVPVALLDYADLLKLLPVLTTGTQAISKDLGWVPNERNTQ